MIGKAEIFQMLEHFGIKKDDKVTVHTSMKAIGPVENGAEGLLDALREYLCDGFLLIPTHTWLGIRERPYYDRHQTPPCIGALPTVAAFHPDAVRSLHPTHSVAVFGKEAAAYVAKEKTFTSGTPADNCLSRLYQEHGKILLLGVGFESNTYIHAVEEALNIPNRMNPETVCIGMLDEAGQVKMVDFHGHRTEGLPYSISVHYPVFEKPLAYLGAVSYGTLGNAKVLCCDAVKTADALKLLWSKADYDLCFEMRDIPEEYYK
ncbi:MAG: AAC(3) family N-acetyltransferase [Oscillospiraceae bacterium]|nr:AAC(3) family N-acetyltransferase [Oscillospiraceae bacterium]